MAIGEKVPESCHLFGSRFSNGTKQIFGGGKHSTIVFVCSISFSFLSFLWVAFLFLILERKTTRDEQENKKRTRVVEKRWYFPTIRFSV
ncbi:hypothetical protein CEXT_697351 [Caerostris extrusa]|uniref:Transmembrane protein n=1 Tax=Caerostris extrusa TaxID=172846 RepID=A0AAV4MI91_CAEEX|nr:hypothetical protein CEXT_697351 [Caerostris extrusa]